MKEQNGTVPRADLEKLFDETDKDKNGSIDAKEMLKLNKSILLLQKAQIRAAVKDLNKQVAQMPKEMRALALGMGVAAIKFAEDTFDKLIDSMDEKKAAETLVEFDKNGDGLVERSEFCEGIQPLLAKMLQRSLSGVGGGQPGAGAPPEECKQM